MSDTTSTEFGTHIIGRTEKALSALLERRLAGTDLTEPQWVTLTLTVISGGTLTSKALAERVAGVLRVDRQTARARIDDLAAARLVHTAENGVVTVTDRGRTVWGAVRAEIEELTHQLWGDQPEEDLATAGRVLNLILDRANSHLEG